MENETITLHKTRNLSTISMHKQSRTLTKPKPKIRIIHIFAPEIIKTDVANFRELVQQLTGKPNHHHHDIHHQKGLKRNHRSRGTHVFNHHQVNDDMNKKNHGLCINSSQVLEDEEEQEMVSMTWNNNGGESSGEFLNGLGDFDGFIEELGEFPYMPLTIDDPLVASSSSSSSSHLHGGVYAESHHFA